LSLIVPTIDEIETAIATAAEPDALSLAAAFSVAKAKSGDDRWDLLVQIFQMMLRAGNTVEPFGPISTYGDRRSMIPSDLTTEQLAALRSIYPGPDHNGYRARVGDVIWLRCHDAQAGEMAANTYSKLGEQLETSAHPYEAGAHFERGVRLAMQINRKGKQVQQHIEFAVARAMAVDPTTTGRLSTDLLALLYGIWHGDADQLGKRSMNVAAAKRAMAHHPAARTGIGGGKG